MQKKIRIAIIGAALITALFFGVYWIQQYLQRSRASATAPTTSFSIAGPKVNPGDSFDLIVGINPNLTPFFSFDIAFTYDPAKVSLKTTDVATILSNITPLSTKGNDVIDVQLLNGIGSTNIDTNNHTVRITAIRATGASDPFMGRDLIQMVKVSFVMRAGQTLPLDFKWIDPDPTKATTSDTFEKKDLSYTGEEPSPTPGPTGIGAVGVPTTTPQPGTTATPYPTTGVAMCGTDICQLNYFCYYPPVSDCYDGETCTDMSSVPYCKQKDGKLELTPTPPLGGAGVVGTTTRINARQDTLYVNSIVTYPAPLRYEQALKLERGSYTLVVAAKLYVKKGTGLVVVLQCNEQSCGENAQKKALRKNDVIYRTPTFPLKPEFSELKQSFTVPEGANNKEMMFRIYCEDGSECDIDYVSLEDAWGSERVKNPQFADVQMVVNPRLQPSSWAIDSTANLYGSVDPAYGENGALMINNPAK